MYFDKSVIDTLDAIRQYCSEQTACEDCIFGSRDDDDKYFYNCELNISSPCYWDINELYRRI